MAEEKQKYPSTFTIDNFSSTTKLESSDVKVPVGSKETLNDYNPFDHRQLEHPNSTFGSLAHLLKSSLGTGILAMPNAFKNGGLLFGFVGTLVIGILCTHCVHILVKASHKMCRKSKTPSFGFSETAGAVFEYGPEKLKKFAPAARITVDIALVVTYYMGTCVYVVFVSGSIKQLVDHYCPDLGWSVHIYMLFILPLLILICQVRELKYLVPFSMLANIFLVISFAITLYYMFNGTFTMEDKNLMAPISRIPLFLSTVVFAMEGIGVVMPVENNMKKPHHFLGCPGVLNTAMATVVVLYGVIGFFGYLKYGEETEGSITYNLPVDEILAQIVKCLVALAIFFTYSLQFYVAYSITWGQTGKHISTRFHNITQIVLRALLVSMTVGVAALVPDLEPIIGLVGSVCLSMLGIFIPAVVDTVICWEGELGTLKWKLWKNIVLMIFSLFALVSGSYESILGLMKLAQTVKALVALAIFFSYTIQFFVAYGITWKYVSPKLPSRFFNIFQVTFRTLIVCGTVGIAAAVPNLEAIIELVGAICFSMLGIFIPAAVDVAINWGEDFGVGKWKLWKNCIIMIFSLIILVSGTWHSLTEIF